MRNLNIRKIIKTYFISYIYKDILVENELFGSKDIFTNDLKIIEPLAFK